MSVLAFHVPRLHRFGSFSTKSVVVATVATADPGLSAAATDSAATGLPSCINWVLSTTFNFNWPRANSSPIFVLHHFSQPHCHCRWKSKHLSSNLGSAGNIQQKGQLRSSKSCLCVAGLRRRRLHTNTENIVWASVAAPLTPLALRHLRAKAQRKIGAKIDRFSRGDP